MKIGPRNAQSVKRYERHTVILLFCIKNDSKLDFNCTFNELKVSNN